MIKKMLLTLGLLVFCFASIAQAAGTCVLSQADSRSAIQIRWITYLCTADSGDATYPSTTITGFRGYYIYSVETWPGGTAPTDDSDFTLSDADGEDLLGGNGTNGIDATDKETILPKSASAAVNFYHVVKGPLTLAITQQAAATNSAIVYVRMTGVK